MGVEGSSKIKKILKNTFRGDTNKLNDILVSFHVLFYNIFNFNFNLKHLNLNIDYLK